MFRQIFILLAGCLLFSSCERIGYTTISKLHFSDDTIYFDTVFSSVGSVTKELRVINSSNRNLKIDRIYIAGNMASQFRLNIDGDPVIDKFDIRVDAGDSIFIFIDALIDPLNNSSPVEISDSIVFIVNEEALAVKLLAWGQDIYLIKNKHIVSETWQKGKPYVIYDKVIVDTLGILTIDEGSRVLFHKNASMIIAGTLRVSGSISSPVLFASDRLEKMYEDIPGQWQGILIMNSSRGNNINQAIIRNAIYGIQLGEAKPSENIPVLNLFSTVIAHSTVSGLSAINGTIEAANCVIYHCGRSCIYISSGGEYSFTNCTLFNRWEYGFRLTPALYISEKSENAGISARRIKFYLNNSVVFGDNSSEIEIKSLVSTYTGYYYFDHCLYKLDTLHSSFWNRAQYPGSIINRNPLFIDTGNWDLRPDSLSALINSGNPAYVHLYPVDIRGVSRTITGNPDIGAFERLSGDHKTIK